MGYILCINSSIPFIDLHVESIIMCWKNIETKRKKKERIILQEENIKQIRQFLSLLKLTFGLKTLGEPKQNIINDRILGY